MATAMTAAARARLSRGLLDWYDQHRRDLPWRRTHDPYAIWVSETMLQQTQVATVVGYYERWMQRFPTLEALASADEQDVLGLWQGLGYYSRARNLRRGAQAVMAHHDGQVPHDPDVLETLPGLGPYSAGAIASIAYQRRTPVVDGNVARVLCRLLGLRGDPKQPPLRKALWARAGELVPGERPGDFNQALMELGATVCTPRAPRCATCPVARPCVARKDGLVDVLPETGKTRETVAVSRVAAVIERRGRYLITQLDENGRRWAGLWVFPTADLREGEEPGAALGRAAATAGVRVTPGALLCTVRHAFTHHRITLAAHRCRSQGAAPRGPSRLSWCRTDELAALPMPAPYRKIARTL